MLDVEARDAAARLATWETDQGQVQLPTVAHVHTDRYPAPEEAGLVLARQQHPTLPSLVVQGTIFTPGKPRDGEGVLPKGLIYPGAAGSSLQEAADDLTSPAGGFQIANRPEALAGHDGLAVLVGARFITDDPWRLPGYLTTARDTAGPNAVLYLPGLGRPDQMALAAYAGVDIFDGLVPLMEGLQGAFLTPEGGLPLEEVTAVLCPCQACQEAEAKGWRRRLLVAHNRWVAEAEARRVRQAIRTGTLRELVEARAHTSPEHLAVLRRLDDEHAGFFETRAPILRQRDMPITSREALGRPEITRWIDRLAERYTPPRPAKVLVVLPCSATKPYENSPTHQRLRPPVNKHGMGRTHVVTLTSPIGAVPEELEHQYPAQHYDIPVTGTWFPEETDAVRRAFQALVDTGAYDQVILHLPPEEVELVEDLFDDPVVTGPADAHVTDGKRLADLADRVAEATAGLDAKARQDLFVEHMRSRADWQFGPGVGDVLLEGTEIKGRYPYLRILTQANEQVAMLRPERGNLTLTTEGGRRLHEATEAYDVEIDDFHPKGTVFAPGVKGAASGIRVEDEVALVHDGDYRGTGRAVAPGPEMADMTSGPCVEVRHHA